MTPGANLIIQRQIARYKSDLQAWTGQVLAARRPLDAFQRAANAPSLGPLSRSLRPLTNADRHRAERQIESHLSKLAAGLEPQDPGYLQVMRHAQGHWPSIYRMLDGKRRRSASE